MGLTNNQTPFSFGNAAPHLTFQWSTTKRDILDVQPRHTEVSECTARALLTDSPQNLRVQLFLQHFHLSFRCLILPLHLRKANSAGVASFFCQPHSCLFSLCCFLFDLMLLFLSFFDGPRLPQANMELQSEHNFGMSVTARTRGRTGLKVVLRVTDHKAGQLVGNKQELSDEIQIQVKEEKGAP